MERPALFALATSSSTRVRWRSNPPSLALTHSRIHSLRLIFARSVMPSLTLTFSLSLSLDLSLDLSMPSVYAETIFVPPTPACMRAVEVAKAALRSRGHELVEVPAPDIKMLAAVYYACVAACVQHLSGILAQTVGIF